MIINAGSVQNLFVGYNSAFNKGFGAIAQMHPRIAIEVPSSTKEQAYPWLGQFPQLREWLGDRIINSLKVNGFVIVNRDFELTYAVRRNDIEDDTYGVFGPIFEQMGAAAKEHPDTLVFECLGSGFTKPFKPMVWQPRIAYQFQQINQEGDYNVFMKNEFTYGVRGRGNAGFGLWPLAFGQG